MATAYRYWRATFVGTTPANVASLEMRLSIDGSGSNLALTGSGTAAASTTANGAPANVFDGNAVTDWGANTGSGQWIQWDFGSGITYDIQHFVLRYRLGNTNQTIYFQGSNDATTWSTRAVLVNTTYTGGVDYPVRAQTFPQVAVVKPAQIIVPGRARSLPGSVKPSGATLKVQDIYSGGQGTISGHVKIRPSGGGADVPAMRKVILIDEGANRIVRATWSRPSDGYFEFKWLDSMRKFTAMAYDYAHGYRAVPADNVSTV